MLFHIRVLHKGYELSPAVQHSNTIFLTAPVGIAKIHGCDITFKEVAAFFSLIKKVIVYILLSIVYSATINLFKEIFDLKVVFRFYR